MMHDEHRDSFWLPVGAGLCVTLLVSEVTHRFQVSAGKALCSCTTIGHSIPRDCDEWQNEVHGISDNHRMSCFPEIAALDIRGISHFQELSNSYSIKRSAPTMRATVKSFTFCMGSVSLSCPCCCDGNPVECLKFPLPWKVSKLVT